MTDLHRLLLRQLKRVGLDTRQPPADQAAWAALLERVSRAYTEADQERYLMERSQLVSSKEMQQLYERLESAQRVAGLGHWSFDRDQHSRIWSEECFRIFARDPADGVPYYEEFVPRLHPQDRAVLLDAVAQAWRHGRKFELELRVHGFDDQTRWVHATGETLADDHGVVRLHGTVMDITRRKLAEQRRAMEHAVTRLMAEAEDPLEVVNQVVQSLCEPLGWACGALWLSEPATGLLRRTVHWCAPESNAEAFYRLSPQAVTMDEALGVLRRAAGGGAPVWVSDVQADPHFRRKAGAAHAGLHAALAFPVQASGAVLGVVELLSRQVQAPDPDLMQSGLLIGRQLGQFLHRKRAERALRESEAHFRALVEQASDSFFVHDVEGRILDVNQHGCSTLQYQRDELLGMTVGDFCEHLRPAALQLLAEQLRHRPQVSLESRYRRRDGTSLPVEISIGPIEIDGQCHLLSLVRDISERRRLEEHVRRLAFHDALTGLPNRAMFRRHLAHALAQAQRYRRQLAVLFIDLDRFKNVNDTLGHEAGDRLLQEMGQRLRGCLREGDLVARLGGDEFVVLAEGVDDTAGVAHLGRKILNALVKETLLEGQMVYTTASIGISLYPQDALDEASLMRFADIAMYRAKAAGRNGLHFYSAQANHHSADLLALESGLRRALECDELRLHFQPKVELASGRIVGAEALVRWQHPELGLLSPGAFIAVAEESGLIAPLGQWVLEQACRQIVAWQAEPLPPLRVAVNLSARQFMEEGLLDDIAATLQRVGMDPRLLELEITESMVMFNPERTMQVLGGLRRMGITIAIDDFGVGYSSLAHLRRFQFDVLKIDQSFVKDLGDPACAAITQAIIAMSKSLGIVLVAEGVETQEQLQFLQRHACDQIQGYFFSRPLPPQAFAALAGARPALAGGSGEGSCEKGVAAPLRTTDRPHMPT